MKIKMNDISLAFKAAMLSMDKPVAYGATHAMRLAAFSLQRRSQADIVAGGLGKRLANAFFVEAYPKGGKLSVNAAAFGAFKKGVGYSAILETGGTIQGKPQLWIPLPNAPKLLGGKHASPSAFERATGLKLFSMRRKAGKAPLLGVNVRGDNRTFKSFFKKTTISKFTKNAGRNQPSAKSMAIPLFFGITKANEKARTHLLLLAADEQSKLLDYYVQSMDPDYGRD